MPYGTAIRGRNTLQAVFTLENHSLLVGKPDNLNYVDVANWVINETIQL